MVAYSMYGAVPVRAVKKALLDLKAAGRLDKVKLITLSQLHFDGHGLRRAACDGGVRGDQARPHLPVGRGLVRFARFSPALPPAHGDEARARR